MLRKVTILVVIVLSPLILNGQDSIFKKNNAVIVCHIQEWNDSIVQYMLVDENSRENHFLSAAYIDRIRFQDGRVKSFGYLYPPELEIVTKSRRNTIGIGLIDPVLYTNLRLSFEHRSEDGSFGIFLPISIGLENDIYYRERGLQLMVGLGMNFHVPRKKGRRFYVVGVRANYGRYFIDPNYDYERDYISYGFFNLTNSHSFHIRLSDRIILAPGFEIHPIGWYRHYGLEFFYPFAYSLRLNLLFNI